MAAKELEWATEEVVLKSKKPSREERKNLQIMKLFGKLENHNTKHEAKPRTYQFSLEKASKPRRKVKVDSEKLPAGANSHELESSSTSEPPLIRKPASVVNPLYILNCQDLSTHIVDYGAQERADYTKTISTKKLDLDDLPGSTEGIKMLPQEAVDRTNRAFFKIQNKFTELKSKLSKPSSKQHNVFNAQYLNSGFLLN